MNPSQRLEAILSRLLDDETPDPSAERELEDFLEAHPDSVSEVMEHLLVAEALRHHAEARNGHDFSDTCCQHILRIANEPPEWFPRRIQIKLAFKRRALLTGGIAALLLLTLTLAALWPNPTSVPPSPPVRQIAVGEVLHLETTARTTEASTIHAGQTVHLTRGIMQLRFDSGAILAVESPARFTIIDALHVRLSKGRATGWCPPSAQGFQVETNLATLIDRGTSFGVHKHTEVRSADFIVFDGAVDIRRDDSLIHLTQTDSVNVSEGTVSKRSFKPMPYSPSWRVCHGILHTEGHILPCLADIPPKLALQRDDENILIFPEKRGMVLEGSLRAEITTPGLYEMQSMPLRMGYTPVDTDAHPVNSYLLRSAPFKKIKQRVEHLRFRGSVTFDAPVIAIMVGKETLEASDPFFLTGEWPKEKKHDLRGLERNMPSSPIKDTLRLSGDRRTLHVDFSTGVGTDEVRVLTIAPATRQP